MSTNKELTQKQKRMKAAMESMANYMATYEEQIGSIDYSDETFIDDVLYGLGVALEPDKHRYANGFDTWKEQLRKHLQKDEE